MALLSFDATTVAPSTGREPIPGGLYNAKITVAEIKPTNDGSGKRLNLQFKILGGEFDGRVVFAGLNIENKSEQAQKIAQGELSAICHAINVLKLTSTDQLLEKPLRIKVKIKAATMENGAEKYPARNEIDSYEAVSGTGQAGGTTQRPAGAARPQGGTPTGGGQARPAGFGNRPTTAAPAAAQGNEQAAPVTRQAPARPATRPAAAPAPAPVTDVAPAEEAYEEQAQWQEGAEEQPWDEQ